MWLMSIIGVSLAYALTREGVAPNAKIVLLEAKDVASGACEFARRQHVQ